MEKDKKKKTYKHRKKKITEISMEERDKTKKLSKKTSLSFSKEYIPIQLNLEHFGQTPINICELENLITIENTASTHEDNYHQIISKKLDEIKAVDNEINEYVLKKPLFIDIINYIKENIENEEQNCRMRIDERSKELNIIEILEKELNDLEEVRKKYEMKRNIQKKLYESSLYTKSDDILLCLKEIEQEKKNLLNIKNKNNENKNKIPEIIKILEKKEQEINENKLEKEKQTKIKNTLKEEYEKVNKIAINDNIFCHNNFFSLLTFFPYFKNVAFISNNSVSENTPQNEEIKDINNLDENKIIINKEINDIDKEELNKIKDLLTQNENSNINTNFKILKDRRTVQISLREKYKFKKIFSIINNNYIAEPWNPTKYTSLKLSTINSYFNEFNMTAISNNYFIIYYVQNLEKTSLNNELHKLYQNLKNNEYIDRNIVIKISVITDSNYINLQNINQESKVKNQLTSITNSSIYKIYGFLYEFTKTNRLNKKNSFRIYVFDYFYPQAVDMMNTITKYYAKKKRKKTGVYKKVIKGQGKQKKRQADKSTTNNHINANNNIIKGKQKPNNNNNKSNANKIQIKKNINKSNIGNLKKNNSFFTTNQTNNKINKNNNNKKVNVNNTTEDTKIIKKSRSKNQSIKKEKSKIINVNINNSNNIKVVKFDEKPKSKSITPKKNNSANKNAIINKQKASSLVFNDLKIFKPEHTLVIHDINSDFVNSIEFRQVAKACGLLNNLGK